MNIVLCGMMGCGKSTVAAELCELTGMEHADTDAEIVKAHGRIADIFQTFGEPHFREIEREVTAKVASRDGLVISTGGGCVLKPENAAAFKAGGGKIVFLKVDIEVLFERTGHTGDERPLLKNTTFEKMKNLLDYRTPIYESCADYTVDTNGMDVDTVARTVVQALGVPLRSGK